MKTNSKSWEVLRQYGCLTIHHGYYNAVDALHKAQEVANLHHIQTFITDHKHKTITVKPTNLIKDMPNLWHHHAGNFVAVRGSKIKTENVICYHVQPQIIADTTISDIAFDDFECLEFIRQCQLTPRAKKKKIERTL